VVSAAFRAHCGFMHIGIVCNCAQQFVY
jgi:hypothetical protein